MEIKEIFKRLGLPKHANTVYTLLQKKGPMNPTTMGKHARLYRPAVYRALSSLLEKHFIIKTKINKRYFYHATNFQIIAKAFNETSATIFEKTAKQIIADDIYKQKEINFLNGYKGIQTAFNDVISHTKYGETFYRYTSEKNLDAVNKYLSKNYRTRRDKKKLERMVISNPVSGMRKKPRLERFVKFIPPKANLFEQNIIQIIYGKRVSLIDLNTERVLIIENENFANFQKVIFRQLYDKLPLP